MRFSGSVGKVSVIVMKKYLQSFLIELHTDYGILIHQITKKKRKKEKSKTMAVGDVFVFLFCSWIKKIKRRPKPGA